MIVIFVSMIASDNARVTMVTEKRDRRNGDDNKSDRGSRDDSRRVEAEKEEEVMTEMKTMITMTAQ